MKISKITLAAVIVGALVLGFGVAKYELDKQKDFLHLTLLKRSIYMCQWGLVSGQFNMVQQLMKKGVSIPDHVMVELNAEVKSGRSEKEDKYKCLSLLERSME